jgi:5-methyltetrahydrofolate--homocysteine methyltransferase
LEINEHALIPAIQEVGRRYDRKELFLPQMILAAEAMQRAFDVMKTQFDSLKSRSRGKVLICTVKGDVHDIGKNIVALFLKNNGFEVTDLGKDVPAETIAREALKMDTHVVALSALMTTTMVEMPRVISALRAAGSNAKVVVGGAVVTQRYAEEIGADGFAKDGVSAVEMIEKFAGKNICERSINR